ncbi:MAG: efflux RND transporter periplasmic adaptor subunit [Terriglobia bacterium]|jgi:cobalt-zinc-cadmium efflux system membrane fusion protein
MNRLLLFEATLCVGLSLFVTGCARKGTAQANQTADTGPVPTKVEPDMDSSNFKVDHSEQFPLATAGEHIAAPELNVTGVVNPDVSQQAPVPSLATGRVVEISARLGDEVKKGQLLFKVRSSDIAGAYSDYRKAVKNEQLAKIQLDRAKLLYDDGAIPKSQLEAAQNAEDNAVVDVETTTEHLHLLGSDPDHPSGIVEVYAPVSGVITDQQITNSSGVQALTPPNPFTISDLSHVWIICDVYENNLSFVRLGEYADVHLSAYPDLILKGRIGNIGAILDPNLRTAKVRLEVHNPGMLRLGMFVTATFFGPKKVSHATVPATAVLHLHDRDWVYAPMEGGRFRRIEVAAGKMLPGNLQEVMSGIQPGQQVVADALALQSTVEQ